MEGSGDNRAMLAFDQMENLSLAEGSDEESGAKTVHTLISRTVQFLETMPERIDLIQAAAVSVLVSRLSVIAGSRIPSELKLEAVHTRQLVNMDDDILMATLQAYLQGTIVCRVYTVPQKCYFAGSRIYETACREISTPIRVFRPGTFF